MHDTSTQSISRWKAVGTKRNQSSILSPSSGLQARKQSRKYRPSKQREMSSSKLFNKNRSRIQSLDNIPKEDLNDSHIKDPIGSRTRRVQNSEDMKVPMIRVSSQSNFVQAKDFTGLHQSKSGRIPRAGSQKQLIALKQDYNKFKQKILAELQIQKQNISKMVNDILQSVRSQLLVIEEKYARNSNLKRDQSMPVFSSINMAQFNGTESKSKLADISTINNIPQGYFSRNPTEKAIISQLTSLKTVEDDPITQRFSKFYSAIERLKSDLDCLHEISTVNSDSRNIQMIPATIPPSQSTNPSGYSQGFSSSLKI